MRRTAARSSGSEAGKILAGRRNDVIQIHPPPHTGSCFYRKLTYFVFSTSKTSLISKSKCHHFVKWVKQKILCAYCNILHIVQIKQCCIKCRYNCAVNKPYKRRSLQISSIKDKTTHSFHHKVHSDLERSESISQHHPPAPARG